MATATLALANGTKVTIEGSPTEVHELLGAFDRQLPSKRRRQSHAKADSQTSESTDKDDSPNLHEIVNTAKTCDQAEAIEHQILDRTSQVDRILLPLYIIHEHFDNRFGLSSGEIARVTRDLGVPVSQPNVSKTLSSVASRYVMGDTVRQKGRAVKYKLNRRGLQYLKSVIDGEPG
jgi:hypothetical protein